MNLSNAINNIVSENNNKTTTREEIVYRKNGKSIDRIIEVDVVTGCRVRTTHYDYFNDKKVRSIDEYDKFTGRKIRTVNYILYKSIDEYDPETGKKIRTTNFNIKDENKISSIQEYDLVSGKIIKISIFKRDGKTVSIIKEIDPETEKITSWVNNKQLKITPQETILQKPVEKIDSYIKTSVINNHKDDIARLIDNLYCNRVKFENIH